MKIHNPSQGMLLRLNNNNKSASRNKGVSIKIGREKRSREEKNQRNTVRRDILIITIYISLVQKNTCVCNVRIQVFNDREDFIFTLQ